MSLVHDLTVLALKHLARGVLTSLGATGGKQAVEHLERFLTDHFRDPSQRLGRALRLARERAWKTLEVSLADDGGDSLWDGFKDLLARADDQALARQVRSFLDECALSDFQGQAADVRQECLDQLRAARRAGLLHGPAEDVAGLCHDLACFADPLAGAAAEAQTLARLGAALKAEYPRLAWLLGRPASGAGSVLAQAAAYYFRREVETDEQLFRLTTYCQLQGLSRAVQEGLDSLHQAFNQGSETLEQLLAEVAQLREAVRELLGDIRAEKDRSPLRASRALRARDTMCLATPQDRQRVRDLLDRSRGLREKTRLRAEVLNDVGLLAAAAGQLEDASRSFREAAEQAPSLEARAVAHANAFRVALERRRFDEALAEHRQAIALDPARQALFPSDDYEAERILGAGGFGVAFLCRHRLSGGMVVIKALVTDFLERDAETVFAEARHLEGLDDKGIIRLRHCGFAGADRSRPYLVMDYFDGLTLQQYVQEHGPLSIADLLSLARQIAEALQAAHAKGILHRDVKPGNVLVRREPAWRVKLIDFGLALQRQGLPGSTTSEGRLTLAGHSLAGTLDYAAPEQIGRHPGPAGTPADVYGFGRTCCFALFGTPNPRFEHWRSLPSPALARLLDRCINEDPAQRPRGFLQVLEELARLEPAPPPPPLAPGPVPVAPLVEVKVPAVEVVVPELRPEQPTLEGLPPLPDAVLKLEGQIAGLERAICGLQDGTHESLRPAQVAIALIEQQLSQLRDEVSRQSPRVPEAVRRALAERLAHSPDESVARLCELAPGLPPEDVLAEVALLQPVARKEWELPRAHTHLDAERARHLDALRREQVQAREALRRAQEEDFAEVLLSVFRGAPGAGFAALWIRVLPLLRQRRYLDWDEQRRLAQAERLKKDAEAWERAAAQGQEADCQAYLRAFPQGHFRAEATRVLEEARRARLEQEAQERRQQLRREAWARRRAGLALMGVLGGGTAVLAPGAALLFGLAGTMATPIAFEAATMTGFLTVTLLPTFGLLLLFSTLGTLLHGGRGLRLGLQAALLVAPLGGLTFGPALGWGGSGMAWWAALVCAVVAALGGITAVGVAGRFEGKDEPAGRGLNLLVCVIADVIAVGVYGATTGLAVRTWDGMAWIGGGVLAWLGLPETFAAILLLGAGGGALVGTAAGIVLALAREA